jgi:hypothetical protein
MSYFHLFSALDGDWTPVPLGVLPFALVRWASGIPEEAGLPSEAILSN